MVSSARSEQSFLVRHRGDIGRIGFLFVIGGMLFTASLTADYSRVDWLVTAVGWLLAFCGAGLRLWCTRYIGGRKDKELQTAGPYSLVRHPLYLGSLLITLGWVLALGNPLVALVVLGFFGLQYQVTINTEEAVLANLFGEQWEAYTKSTPLFIPRLRLPKGQAPELVKPHFLRREYVTAGLVVFMLALSELIKYLNYKDILPLP
jgi:protein-S-isoprenylcysteine O-methyltransferase Ste14